MPSGIGYALTQALGLNRPNDQVADRANAARAALDSIVGGMGVAPLSEIGRTPAPQLRPVGGSSSMRGVSPMTSSGGPNPEFVRRLQALIAASGGRVSVQGGNWGYRNSAQQAALYRARPNLAARPGHSLHERGMAADLSGDLALAHRLAAQFGLRFPMLNPNGSKYEPWHIQYG